LAISLTIYDNLGELLPGYKDVLEQHTISEVRDQLRGGYKKTQESNCHRQRPKQLKGKKQKYHRARLFTRMTHPHPHQVGEVLKPVQKDREDRGHDAWVDKLLFFKKVYLQERLCPLTKQDS
jgi:hypothetical protein